MWKRVLAARKARRALKDRDVYMGGVSVGSQKEAMGGGETVRGRGGVREGAGEGAGAPSARPQSSDGAASSSAGFEKALLAMRNLAVAAIPSFVPSRSATTSWGETE